MEHWGTPALTNVISEKHFFKTPPSGLNADRLTTISQIGPNPFSSYTLHTSQLKFSSKVSREEPCQTLFPAFRGVFLGRCLTGRSAKFTDIPVV
ncbi:hypothetical protein J6590_051090 [Homalodisca vitripennis]|nr:hypothetical protein J6590_051090 [Homalodisca vitripennis]